MAVSFRDTFSETFRRLADQLEIYKVNSVTVNGSHTAIICNDGQLLYCHIGTLQGYGSSVSQTSTVSQITDSKE